ncbi:MAG TPA: hypothetical protein VFJ81_10165, partial [Gemmatimonadales bacterium]|nr:hypothetical protein [Gemmatimonadales bacterium]
GEDWGDFNDSTETLLGARRPARVDSVWRCAARLGYMAEFPDGVSQPIIDDHLPLQRAGLEVIDVIDLQYGPDNRGHHATEDTRDKISGESLARTAHLATALVRGCFERP